MSQASSSQPLSAQQDALLQSSSNQFAHPADQLTFIIRNLKMNLIQAKAQGPVWVDLDESTQKIINSWGGGVQESPQGENATGAGTFACQGPDHARIFIVDSRGHFFKGESGKLLIKILGAMHLKPEDVFICNAEDFRAIHKQIRAMSPKAIITLGRKAGQKLLNLQTDVAAFRGKLSQYCGVKVMPTFHPARLIEQPDFKRQVWEDMKQVMTWTGLHREP